MRANRILLLPLLMVILFLQGCWDAREIPQLAIVSSMGIDKSATDNQYHVSFQVVNPSEISAGITGAGGGRTTPVTVYSSHGKTIFEAIRNASITWPRQLFFSHTRIIIIGEELAREGIADLLDLFERMNETRLTSRVMIARESTAEEVLSTIAPIEKIPANAVNGRLKFTSMLLSQNMEIQVDDIIRALGTPGTEPVINGIRLIGNKEQGHKQKNVEQTEPQVHTEISGIAIFKDGKLKKWIDGMDARGVVRVQNKIKSSADVLDCKEKKDAISIELLRSTTKVKAQLRGGEPFIHIAVKQEGSLNEIMCGINLQRPEEIAKLEQQWSELVKEEVMGAVRAAQKEKCDVFGFSQALNRDNPDGWKKVAKKWDALFAECEVHVTVDSFIRHSGMRTKSYSVK
ncbi:Ger(x)C family spore germination protein [Paenibacillus sp. DMB20]|uniref:Ger(x)C family spore germination protein n=1 Tax=Paenibacillus sp. DMB20 TaxID=1642570 RepID=UPI0006278FDB|nr:Ger(x)C family spore germination protein [Paenibacillus sp. DMB20]KKO50770.1 spore gernimation protein GerC [Paenibacillus sp. DMB20]